MIPYQRVQQILATANMVKNNPDIMKKHLWKTKPCTFGINCTRILSQCAGCHYIEEYKVPMCLYLEICRDTNCDRYHPNRCTVDQYIYAMGIDKILMKRSVFERRLEVEKQAITVMNTPQLLREHLYRTRKCFNGLECSNKDKCPGAHFSNEYRLPMCLKMEFCFDPKCQNFHQHKQTKESYMEIQGISFEYSTSEEYDTTKNGLQDLLKPLTGPNPNISLEIKYHKRAFTTLCDNVTESSPCTRSSCPFAHSLDELILPMCLYNDNCSKKEVCKNHHPSQDIAESARRILSRDIPSYYLRPCYENSSYLMMLLNQILMIEDMKEENEEDDKNIDERRESFEDILDFLTEEETELENFYFDLDFNPKFFSYDNLDDIDDIENIDIRIDFTSISKIIQLEKDGVLNNVWTDSE